MLSENLEASATRREARPIGEALGQVTDMKVAQGTVQKADSPRRGQPWFRLDWTIEVTDPEYLALRTAGTSDKEIFTYGIMYDADDSGRPKVGPNTNISLGRFRDACNANGKPLQACIGAPVRIMVNQKPHPKEEGVVLDEITAVTRA